MKKVISFLLVCMLLIGCVFIPVNAQSDLVLTYQMNSKKLHGASATNHKQTVENVLSQYIDLSTFTSLILSGISNCEAQVDVESYNIPVDVTNYISDYFFYGVPEAFNIYKMGCTYYGNANTIVSITIKYYPFADTKSEYDACFSKMSTAANKLLSGIKGNSSLSDEQKLLLLHDRLAVWNTYGYPENTTDIEAHTAYGALGNRMSVCQGYAMAYMYLLNQINIESYYCSSDALNHGWNIVYLGGKKYHVDVTWDDLYWADGADNAPGAVEHSNFLRSSNGIYAEGHSAFDYDTTPTDTKYDNYFWQNSETEFQLVNNEIYYLDNNAQAIKRYSDKKTLCDVTAKWKAGAYSTWTGNFSCLSSDGTSLFYSQPKAIYRFDISTNKSSEIFVPQISDDYQSIYCFTYEDGNLVFDIHNAPIGTNDLSGKYTLKVPYENNGEEQPDEDITFGDVTNDGSINNKDLGILMQYINGWSVSINIAYADVNNDGKINNKDYGTIMRYINGWDVKLG